MLPLEINKVKNGGGGEAPKMFVWCWREVDNRLQPLSCSKQAEEACGKEGASDGCPRVPRPSLVDTEGWAHCGPGPGEVAQEPCAAPDLRDPGGLSTWPPGSASDADQGPKASSLSYWDSQPLCRDGGGEVSPSLSHPLANCMFPTLLELQCA